MRGVDNLGVEQKDEGGRGVTVRMKRLSIGAFAVAAIVVSLMASSALAGPKGSDEILIGISAAKTGILAPYDLQAGQLFQLRIEQINKAGGVLGRKLRVQWIDTKTDKALAATNAEELIANGAVAIIATCDFDYSFPAINAARGHEVAGIALCASSPKVATPAIVGAYGGSMGLGSDAEGVAGAEWIRKNRPQLKRAYIYKDTSLEYSKATADYFKARWRQLGGTICGEDVFVGGTNLDLSSQITRLRGKVMAAIRIAARQVDSRCGHQHRHRHERVGQRHAREAGGWERLQLLRAGLRLPAHVLQGDPDAARADDRPAVQSEVRPGAGEPLRPSRLRARERDRRGDQADELR